MSEDELKIVLEKHRKWLNDEPGGERAEMYNAKLCNADLYRIILELARNE
jgi:hypothetical protein